MSDVNTPNSKRQQGGFPEPCTASCSSNKQSCCKGVKSQAIFALRDKEFRRLDRDKHVYLDYTGGNLYPESLVRAHMEILLANTFGNPHSNNPTSLASTELCEKARRDVLKFFNADPSEYLCIFTPNASGALRIVGESFPFEEGGQYLLLVDNHNSVNGIREFARSNGAEVAYAKTSSTLRIDEDVMESLLEYQVGDGTKPKLFAFPAQSNFSGVKHSLEWIERAQERGWHVLLDAAAFVPTSPLDLSAHKPEFVSMSFYKMFGYPTGIGALIMKKSLVPKMRRPWFAGGTIKFVTTEGTHVLAADHEAFEDGTINYLGLPAISLGLDWLSSIGMETLNSHIHALTEDLIKGLQGLKHSSGKSIVRILGPTTAFKRGGTVTIDVFDADDVIIAPAIVEKLANARTISIRSGCFCNPGDSEMLFPEAWKTIREVLSTTGDAQRAREQGLNVAAAIRISIGIATSEGDIAKLISFLGEFKDKPGIDFAALGSCSKPNKSNCAHA